MTEFHPNPSADPERSSARKLDPPVRHGHLPPQRARGTVAKLLATVVAVAVISSLAVGTIVALQFAGALEKNAPQIHPGPPPVPPRPGAYPGGFNILIVGSDTRSGQGGIGGSDGGAILNDVTMLLHVSGDHTQATAVSFPRDLIVAIPACAAGGPASALRINTALYYGGSTSKTPGAGLACAVKTVETLTGLDIQFAGIITFKGVIALTDAIGGVPVCVAGDVNDSNSGLHLKKGTHKISGRTALAFLRSRHGVGDGSDLGRISSQQVYLSSLVRTLKSKSTLSDPTKIYALAKAATKHMQLSRGFGSIDTLYTIAIALKDIPLNRVLFLQYPSSVGVGGVYENAVAPDQARADVLFTLLRADKPFKIGTVYNNRGSVAKPGGTKTPTSTPTKGATPSPIQTPKNEVDVPSGQPSDQVTCAKPFSE